LHCRTRRTENNGAIAEIDGRTCIYIDGYWIKYYEPPPESLEAKKALIEALTRRLFNHVEHGINIPGLRLAEARAAYEHENDPERKRVNGAMLAGALFNRAATIFTKLVELKADGVEVEPDDALMKECGDYLLEALELGHMVRHRGGDEGIDELWGEPFKAFSQPIAAFYQSRYIKIALTMRDIDRITATLVTTFEGSSQVPGVGPMLAEFGRRGQAQVRDPAHRPGHLRGLAGLRRRPRPAQEPATAAAASAVVGGDPSGAGGQPHPQGRHRIGDPYRACPRTHAEKRARPARPVRPISSHLPRPPGRGSE
jgi:hypothetical protein